MADNFQKRYVRVEWLAVQAAVDLLLEAGFDNSYFVSESRLVGDEGIAVADAEYGRELHDEDGQPVKWEELHATDFGLADEIGEFAPKSSDTYLRDDQKYYLKRTYGFWVTRQGERDFPVSVFVSFAKRTQDADWELVHECVVDQRRSGDERWVIYRSEEHPYP